MLRHDIRYTGKTSWSIAYYRWLSTLNFGAGATQVAFTEYWRAVEAADERVERLKKALEGSITGWRFAPVVGALQALRGAAAITAICLTAEVGDLGRFSHPRKLMGYLGLVPSEHSSGERTSRGSITKTGNAHVRATSDPRRYDFYVETRINLMELKGAGRCETGASGKPNIGMFVARCEASLKFSSNEYTGGALVMQMVVSPHTITAASSPSDEHSGTATIRLVR